VPQSNESSNIPSYWVPQDNEGSKHTILLSASG
jgi:hypothetical protein